MKEKLLLLVIGVLVVLVLSFVVLETASKPEHTLTVFAAAALTEPFEEYAHLFEQEHPDVKVELNFASASILCTQIEQGAEASVYAAPYPTYATRLINEGFARSYRPFAYNTMVVAVPKNGTVHSLSELTEDGVRIVMGQKNTPIGIYARGVVSKLNTSGLYGEQFEQKVMSNVVSEEDNTKYVYSKVVLNEADAGFVLSSDISSPSTSYIEIPEEYNVRVCCAIAVLDEADPHAEEFEELVLSEAGQRILEECGFVGVDDVKDEGRG